MADQLEGVIDIGTKFEHAQIVPLEDRLPLLFSHRKGL